MRSRTRLWLGAGVALAALLTGCPKQRPAPERYVPRRPVPSTPPAPAASTLRPVEVPEAGVRLTASPDWSRVEANTLPAPDASACLVQIAVGEGAGGVIYTLVAAAPAQPGLDAMKPLVNSLTLTGPASPASRPVMVAWTQDKQTGLPQLQIQMTPAAKAKELKDAGKDPVAETLAAARAAVSKGTLKPAAGPVSPWTHAGIVTGRTVTLHPAAPPATPPPAAPAAPAATP
ncbi:MAG: hypothetical protein HYU66_16565 [Armatimonadetes bacterium]|nr:hypothetical protein [Armatimonadota bacterium]